MSQFIWNWEVCSKVIIKDHKLSRLNYTEQLDIHSLFCVF